MRGTVLAGRYTLAEPLGPGGGTWLARDEVLHRDVAVKRIPLTAAHATTGAQPGSGAVERERVLAEARFAASLSHPGLVTVHDVLATGPQPWVVMDLIRGGSLDRVTAAEGPLEPGRVAAMGLRLLDALAVVHAHGHLHGAVTPGNVLIAATGETVLAGLGTTTPAPSADVRMLVTTLMFALDGGSTPRPDNAAASPALLPLPREAAALRAALARARDGAEVRAVLTEAAARAAVMAAEVPTVPTEIRPTSRGRTLWLSAAAATALVATVAALAVARPGTATRDSASTATTAATTPATPTPSRSRTAAAAPSPDPCALVVPTDRVVPSTSSTCSVTVDDASVTIKTQPNVDTARKVFDALRKRRQSQTGTSKVERAVTTPVKNVPGLGDQCFSQDTTVGILSSVSSNVWLRVRTMVIEVSVMGNGAAVTSEMRDTAMRAARTTAARLQGSS
ncbi:serine/threonine-protein kinase [Nonomuraea sp. JJY05]|jgi:serine/threonine protein kinase|uniref:serine/threonine-protein kinase n=1 Tax=Nonomuraea sp. JJY05 TaxID=3350255 RepID=UPI00373F6713